MFFANGRPLQHKRGLVAKSRFESWPQRILYLRGHSESECRGKVRQVPLHGRNIKSNHWAQQLCSKWLRLHLLQAVIWPKLPLKALVNLYPELFFVLFVSRRAAVKIQSALEERTQTDKNMYLDKKSMCSCVNPAMYLQWIRQCAALQSIFCQILHSAQYVWKPSSVFDPTIRPRQKHWYHICDVFFGLN